MSLKSFIPFHVLLQKLLSLFAIIKFLDLFFWQKSLKCKLSQLTVESKKRQLFIKSDAATFPRSMLHRRLMPRNPGDMLKVNFSSPSKQRLFCGRLHPTTSVAMETGIHL